MESKENKTKYLEWKISRNEERYKAEREAWIEQSFKFTRTEDLLRKKNRALQAEVQDGKEKEKELTLIIKHLQTERDKKDQEIADLEKHIKISEEQRTETHAELSEQSHEFELHKESHKNELTELNKKHEEITSGMKADFDNLQHVAQQHEKRAENLQQAVQKLDQEYQELKQRHTILVNQIQNFLQSEEEERKQQMERDLRVKLDIVSDFKIRESYYESRVRRLQKKIADMDHLKNFPPLVDKLNATIDGKCKVIKNKNLEIAALKKEKKDVTENWQTEQNTTALLEIQLQLANEKAKHRHEKKLQEEYLFKDTIAELHKLRQENRDLTEKLNNSKLKVKGSESNSEHLKKQIRQLQNHQKHFLEDLQTCISVINEPKQLKQRVIELKKRHIENNKTVQAEENTEEMYKFQIDCLEKRLQHAASIEQTKTNHIKSLEDRLSEANMIIIQKETKYTSLLNDKILKVHGLQKQLRHTTHQLQRATKSVPNEMQSWISEKVLGKQQVSPEPAEDQPQLYSCDYKPQDLLDDSISFEDVATEDTSASERQHPLQVHKACINDRVKQATRKTLTSQLDKKAKA